ncbi:MAG: xanthine dehydrogenase family protein subunit M [Planctomycetota bacterium]|nr:xanthine dehydrogenase family protein subunit M [Planctomycetota bacterium]
MRDFEYEAPASVAEAVRVLSHHNGTARPLAGGTDLIDQIRVGRHQPALVVDIKRIPELNVLEMSTGGLRLGAAVPCYRVYNDAGLNSAYTALVDSTRIIGGIQIQSRGSIGGNLCNAGPAADSIPSLIALGAKAVIAGPNGRRELPVEEFCVGPGKNALQAGELLVELKFPARPDHSGSHYRRFIPRNEMDIAVVGVGASVVLDAAGETIVSARIGLGAVGPTPLFAKEASELLAGKTAGAEAYELAAAAAQKIATPIDDMRGTKEFRSHLVGVLVRRVLETAVERARNGV